MTMNRFGLSRDPPAEVKRAVRQRCGYGCVICARAPYDYDHFEPEFAQAKSHQAEGIALLCKQHHGEKNSKLLTSAMVAEFNKNPKAKQDGTAFGRLTTLGATPKFKLGSNVVEGCTVLLRVDEEDVIWVSKPEDSLAPFSFNARFRDVEGKVTLEIIENEWKVGIDTWDVQVISNRIELRSAPSRIELILSMEPPDTLFVQRARLSYNGLQIDVDADGTMVIGGIKLQGNVIRGSRAAIVAESPIGSMKR